MKRGFGDNRDGSITVNGMPIVQAEGRMRQLNKLSIKRSFLLYCFLWHYGPGWCNQCHYKTNLRRLRKLNFPFTVQAMQAGKNGLGASIILRCNW